MREVSTQGRGRPKTLDRDQVLQEALMAYWSRGTKSVSISDICLATGASKPGVYREFGNDDGLKASALETYYILAVQPLIDASVDYMTQDRTELGIPQGCLLVNMRAQSQQLGPLTRETLNAFRRSLLSAFAAWAERSKARGECTNIPNDIAALYIDAQHGGAMRMQREGVPNETVANVLRMALCTLVVRSAQ
jgi:AcrR family transcriptional regulator